MSEQTDFIKWLIENGAKYQIRYVDFEKDRFTVPTVLNNIRANYLFDHSIAEIKFTFSVLSVNYLHNSPPPRHFVDL